MSEGISQDEWLSELERALAQSDAPAEGMTVRELMIAMGYRDTKVVCKKVRLAIECGAWECAGTRPVARIDGGLSRVAVYRPVPKRKRRKG